MRKSWLALSRLGYHGTTELPLVRILFYHAVLLLMRPRTGPMGNQSDPAAVVDTHGRVYGVKGVRVVDASIFPFAIPGHSMSHVCKLTLLI